MKSLFCCLGVCLLCGCATVASLTTEQRQRKQFDALQPRKGANQAVFSLVTNVVEPPVRRLEVPIVRDKAAMTLAALVVLPEDDCGACQTNPTVQYVLGPHTTTLEWYQPGTCVGWNVFESDDMVNWFDARMLWSWGASNVTNRIAIFTTNNPVFWRVASY